VWEGRRGSGGKFHSRRSFNFLRIALPPSRKKSLRHAPYRSAAEKYVTISVRIAEKRSLSPLRSSMRSKMRSAARALMILSRASLNASRSFAVSFFCSKKSKPT
jgi:hypothetical protein